jgi:hypothetical protein
LSSPKADLELTPCVGAPHPEVESTSDTAM